MSSLKYKTPDAVHLVFNIHSSHDKNMAMTDDIASFYLHTFNLMAIFCAWHQSADIHEGEGEA